MALAHSPRIVTDNLILYLDAANAKSYPGSGTTWYDLSSQKNHATLSGTYQYVTGNSFLFNSGAQLNGTGRASLNIPDPGATKNYTIECIFKINRFAFLGGNSNIAAQIFSSGRTTGNFDRAFYMGRNSVSGEVQNAGLAWYHANYSDGPGGNNYNYIYVNNIYHTTVTLPSSAGAVNFYINGEFSVGGSTTTTNERLNDDWSIANQPAGWDQGVDSNFYIVRVYERTLSTDEIRQNFNASRGRFGL